VRTQRLAWTGEKGSRVRRRFARVDGEPIWFAGLWDRVTASDEGDGASFTIIASPSSGWLGDHHDRAPVILEADEWGTWLGPAQNARSLLRLERAGSKSPLSKSTDVSANAEQCCTTAVSGSSLVQLDRIMRQAKGREDKMLYTVAVILLVLWLLGFFAFHVGSIIHILLVVAVVAVIYQLITGRRAL